MVEKRKKNRLVKLKKNHFHKVHKRLLGHRAHTRKKSAPVSQLKDEVIRVVDMKSERTKKKATADGETKVKRLNIVDFLSLTFYTQRLMSL